MVLNELRGRRFGKESRHPQTTGTMANRVPNGQKGKSLENDTNKRGDDTVKPMLQVEETFPFPVLFCPHYSTSD